MTDITLDDWISRGYRRFELKGDNKVINKHADFLLQKRLDDEHGARYFITIYCYDRKNYPRYLTEKLPEFGFMATVNFSTGDHQPFFEIQMSAFKSIEQVEEQFQRFWQVLEQPYYERWCHENT